MIKYLPYISIVLLLIVSAFFSASEMALSSSNIKRLRSLKEEKNTFGLRAANRLKEGYDEALGVILIGNNLANNAASSVMTVIILGILGENYVWVSTLVMTLLVLIFCEILPKTIAKQFPEKLSAILAGPLYILNFILMPVNWIVVGFVGLVSKLWENNVSDNEAVSEKDFENIIDIAEDEGVLDEEQCDLLQNALDFDEVLAYEIVTHRVDMDALDIRDPYEVNIKKILESKYSRMPVFEDTPDNVIGILHLNRVFKRLVDDKKINIRELLLPVTFVHKTMSLPDVLEKMRDSKCHMVVVLDEYGGTMGILTMEDVLEQIVGEIFDETDEVEREFVCIDDTHFEASGDMRIYDFFDEFDKDIEEDEEFEGDYSTVSGFVMHTLEGEVNKGDTFDYEELRITILDCDERRIEKISVEILPEPEEDEEEDEDE
ncbi:MAG: HlyC/CorC family transporter [Clostridia bacterium]|nr:HlyC/CorC family transporter [Clostridia bacterium]